MAELAARRSPVGASAVSDRVPAYPCTRGLEAGGRVHLDRAVPFLVLNRYPRAKTRLASRLAAISPSSVLWPGEPAADREAAENIGQILRRQRTQFGHVLAVQLYDLEPDRSLDNESPRLEPFRFVIDASADAPAQDALRGLEVALAEICIEQRDARIEHGHEAESSLPDGLIETLADVSRVRLGIPQIHRVPGEPRHYPEIFHALEAAVFDALLRCFALFIGAIGSTPPAHHRALGRRSFLAAALSIDKELARISASFDFLLGISPINTAQAFAHFSAGKWRSDPVFRYRPLSVSPDLIKRALYAMDIRSVEDPLLERLFREKQQEIDRQLQMLQLRNTPAFRYASLLQYGPVEASLLEEAKALLNGFDAGADPPPDTCLDCHAVQRAAQAMIARYRSASETFNAQVTIRDDIAAGLMVSGRTLMISSETRMPDFRLDALLQHEVGIHLLTCINGSAQGIGIFGSGLAGYEGIQEGLGVFAEYAVGGLTRARIRLLAARVLVVDAMLDGATFVDCHRLLHDEHAFSPRSAFNIIARVYRSGGLSKDAIYLRGLKRVFALIAEGNDLTPFWLGKIAESHLPVVAELEARGMLRAPLALPEFLERPTVHERLACIRKGGSLVDLIRSCAPC